MYQLKKDKYRAARGGYARFLHITCSCKTSLCLYQKDGPGPLKRMYLDRILAPKRLIELEKRTLQKIQKLHCRNCKQIIGSPYSYEKEQRKAFLLNEKTFTKKVGRGVWKE